MFSHSKLCKVFASLALLFCLTTAYSSSNAGIGTTGPTYCPENYTGNKTVTCVDAGTGRFDPQTCSTCINGTKWCCISSTPTPKVKQAWCKMKFQCSGSDNDHHIGINYDANKTTQSNICNYGTLKANDTYRKFSTCDPNSLQKDKVKVEDSGGGYICTPKVAGTFCKM